MPYCRKLRSGSVPRSVLTLDTNDFGLQKAVAGMAPLIGPFATEAACGTVGCDDRH